MRRRGALLAAALLAAGALAPTAAQAHGVSGSADVPIPEWMFAWAAAIVLIASFVALGALWPRPRLQQPRPRRVATIPLGVRTLCGLIGVGLYGVVVYAALAGTEVPTANLAPTVVYVAFWVGIPLSSVLLGDVFALFSPWRALYRWIAGAARRVHAGFDAEPIAYPAWLGRWPAALGLAAFAWVELAYVDKDVPATLGVLALVYGFVQVVGMSLFGERTWSERADAFGVYFGLCARISIWETRGRELCVRPLLSGLPRLELLPGTVAVLAVLIGSTTFDGASNGVLWVDAAPWLQDRFADLGASLTLANELASTVGLALAIAAVAAFYELGIRGMRTVDRRRDAGELARAFVHTLVPIAFAYAVAHYFSLLVFQGQALIYLASDPLGTGANLLGTANTQVDYTLVSPTAVWYVQVAALVAGHVAGLVLAHDRALAVFSDNRGAAVRSQYWMLTVMVGFTCLGLWLLSAVNA
ncbi:MAG TPA: fenitrothion hydrolase [Conexibacter sp.]|nr:fenitrothion hydrolase [Conexibacter sp.]